MYGSLFSAGCGICAFLGLQTNLGGRFLAQSLEMATSHFVPTAKLKIGKLELNEWTQIQLNDVGLTLTDGDPILEIDTITLNVWKRGDNHLYSTVILDDPIIVVQESNGELNWSRLLLPSQETSSSGQWPSLPLDIKIPIIEVNNAQISVFNESFEAGLDVGMDWIKDQLDIDVHRVSIYNSEMGRLDTVCRINGDEDRIDILLELTHPLLDLEVQGYVTELFDNLIVNTELELQLMSGAGVLVDYPAWPMQEVEVSLMINGPLSEIDARLDSSLGITGELLLNLPQESWDSTIHLKNVEPTLWAPNFEPTLLKGEIHANGNGFDMSSMQDGLIDLSLLDSLVWNQPIPSLEMQSSFKEGVLSIKQLNILHSAGRAELLGTVDLLQDQLDLKVDSQLNNVNQWLPNFVLRAQSSHQIIGTWSEPAHIQVDGMFEFQEINGEGVSLLNTNVQSNGHWDGADINLSNEILASEVNALGVAVPEISGVLNILVSSEGLIDIYGNTQIESLVVGDGTLEFQDVRGGLHYWQQNGEQFLTTQDMTVGDVTLIPAQYVVDGGEISLTIEDNSLRADLHLLRKDKTFVQSQAHSDFSDGLWKIDSLQFSPTGDRDWTLKDGFTFQLTDSGIGDMELELVGDAGAVFVRVDQTNQQPDIALEVSDLDLGYVSDLVNLFTAPDTIPDGTVGQLFGSIHLRGETGQFQDGDYLWIKQVLVPDIIEEIDIIVDLNGSLNQIKPNVTLLANDEPLATLLANIPTIEGQPDCDRPVWMSLEIPEFQFQNMIRHFPILPDLDITGVFEAEIHGDICDPNIKIYTQGHLPIGVNGERVQWYTDLLYVDDNVEGSFEVQEGVNTWLSIDLDGKTHLLPMLNGKQSELELIESMHLEGIIEHMTIQRLSHLYGFSGAGRGRLQGGFELDYAPSSWTLKGNIDFPKVKLAKHRLHSASGFHFSIHDDVLKSDWVFDFINKGDFSGEIEWNMISDDVFLTSNWQDVPATTLSIVVPEMQNEYGRLAGSVLAEGTLEDPKINAIVQVQNLGFQMPSLGTKYRKINFEARLENNLITIPFIQGEGSYLQTQILDKWGQFNGGSTMTYEDAFQEETSMKKGLLLLYQIIFIFTEMQEPLEAMKLYIIGWTIGSLH